MKDLKALVKNSGSRRTLGRRDAIRTIAAAAGCALLSPGVALRASSWKPRGEDEAFLEDLVRLGCLFFWEQASENTGQILDRALNNMNGTRDARRMASIASTGFGLTALCIADQHGYLPHAQIMERVKTTVDWHLNKFQEVHGFFYHFSDIETGERWARCEVSPIDTSILLCGILTAKAYFNDDQISKLAQQVYDRVDWPWMLNEGKTFAMGWHPEAGFTKSRWAHYCELMMMYLLAIGSRSNPVSPELWNAFSRPVIHYAGYAYISGNDPLFTHQFSHAWFDFRNRRDAYANYFDNSAIATRAHKAFCLSFPDWYKEDHWGVSASDSATGYIEWGGPPIIGPLDGTVVPYAAAGSLAFLPEECLAVLRAMRSKWGNRAWGRYGFVDAFHPAANWYDPDVIGIDQGISVLMAENLRSGAVWSWFMRNAECANAMQLVGFKPEDF